MGIPISVFFRATTRTPVALLVALSAGIACSSGEPNLAALSSAGGAAADTSIGGSSSSATSVSGGAPMQSTGGTTNNIADASTVGGQPAIGIGGSDSVGGLSSTGGNDSTGGSQAVTGTGSSTSINDAAFDGSSSDADSPDGASGNQTPFIVLSDDGGWCWFESPRAIIVGNKLIVGSVASGYMDANRRGDIEAIVHDLSSGDTNIVELHDQLELDDHDSAVFLARPDGRLLTLYGKHGGENKFHYRISEPNDGLHWGEEQAFVPSTSSAVTYSNIYRLTSENDRVYDFFRGLDGNPKPSFAYSDDLGQSWNAGNIVVNVATSSSQRPYVRYASNGSDTIHLVYTDGHPRDVNNSLYHIYYRNDSLYRSDGAPIGPLTHGLDSPSEGTLIFPGDADNVAWVSDVVLDDAERPVTTYSVQVGSAGLPPGQGGDDIRYRYARWDGTTWRDYPLAYAGTRLYAGEDDYSGLATIDPADVSVVYLSTNADPASGVPLVSAADGARHYEIFRAQTADGGGSWTFTPITQSSSVDNLRPIVVRGHGDRTRVLLWLRGQYRAYTDYRQQVVALIETDTNVTGNDGGER